MAEYAALERCRMSGSKTLVPVLDLGEQALTGVFPRSVTEPVTVGPLRLLWCPDSGLLQLGHSYEPSELSALLNYGYRSGLNQSMVRHLAAKVLELQRAADPRPGDTVLDIGSNDATLLKAYSIRDLHRIGIDPTGAKFRQYYPDDITLVTDFFSAAAYRRANARPAQIVTSIAMFYDLEDPVAFAREIEQILAPNGIWHFEQSYMPSMLRMTSYDTVCHEHLEYYSLTVVTRILAAAGMRAIDVKMNAVNGGSFAVTAVRADDPRHGSEPVIEWLLEQEEGMGLDTPRPYRDFEERVFRHRTDLLRLCENALQLRTARRSWAMAHRPRGMSCCKFCGITQREVAAIAEVNEDKFWVLIRPAHTSRSFRR